MFARKSPTGTLWRRCPDLLAALEKIADSDCWNIALATWLPCRFLATRGGKRNVMRLQALRMLPVPPLPTPKEKPHNDPTRQ